MRKIALLVCLALVSLNLLAQDTLRLKGLKKPVEIIKDQWGIAHIYAQNEEDLFFAQGYSAASDRLFQFEMWRRQATGTVAEVLGAKDIKRDIGTRLFKFRGDIEQELNHYHPRGAIIVKSFVRGINAYIDEILKTPEKLPFEFSVLDIKPKPWTPDVVISRHQGLLSNVQSELNYGRLVHLLGAEKVKDILNFHPGDPNISLDKNINGELLFQNILELYDAFRKPLNFTKEEVKTSFLENTIDDSRFTGSNNWVIGGKISQSGFPMLANDPHRAQNTPALRYWCHLNAPGWNVVGGGEPTIPGISIGHNDYGAWGLTIFQTDNEDLYIYDANPKNPNQYRYKGIWENLKIITDTIKVLNAEPVVVQLKYTRHGPVVFEDDKNHKLFGVRAGWLEAGCSPYLASLRMNQAKSWEEFREACSFSRIPGENMIWADRKGTIGWQAVGISPVRPNWTGLVPVTGDGRYEWAGYLNIKQLPNQSNPAGNYIITANNNLTPENFPYRNAIGWEWASPYRAHRIEEVLGSGKRQTMTDFMQLQNDYMSLAARNFVPLLIGITSKDKDTEKARKLLLDWDFNMKPESIPATIYLEWSELMEQGLIKLIVPENARTYIKYLSTTKMVDWLISGRKEFGKNPVVGRDEFMINCLDKAVENIKKRLGNDINDWQYGQLKNKHISITHPMSTLVNADMKDKINVGPFIRGGNGETVNSTGDNLNQSHGASFRIIVDTKDWDNTLGNNSPGQSGNPDSPHYKDLIDLWAKGQYFPVYFSKKKIKDVAEQTLILKP
ncbi:penicillin acylase family protein [Emticicia sp. BO119]|uniref:penicillin acylase family protein n=1 Tax=Emticicia sp. BO119 TaxID=2757768 RepID=UPI0015F0348C|nr:penicillin acylase family protein [Emticicia sp. BO119]MBA4850324.1 penicillin acylase family protein [Emticicia sp. BO119]